MTLVMRVAIHVLYKQKLKGKNLYMKVKKRIISGLRSVYWISLCEYYIRWKLPSLIFGDKIITIIKFYKKFGRFPNLRYPSTMNEKLQWLKLHDRREFCTLCADKYRVREYLKKEFGEEYIVPLLYMAEDYKNIIASNMPPAPCVVKSNTGTGGVELVHNWEDIEMKKLQNNCRKWIKFNHYYVNQEWQYKNVKPCIIVEKMMLRKDGKIPADYKFHFINGKLQFIYCCYDREGDTVRAIYDTNWEKAPFQWISKRNYHTGKKMAEIPKPESFEKMREMGEKVAKNFKYVRVDFYDVDGKPYFGEITLYHGAGYNCFYPDRYDSVYGEILQL